MAECTHRGRTTWRCPVPSCRTYKSIASGNDFFVRMSETGCCRRKLRLHDIADTVWQWCYSRMTLDGAAVPSGVSKRTVSLWHNYCRAVCTATESVLLKMTGTAAQPIQIDESYFRGRRKYNRGKCRLGDITMPGEHEARAEMEVEIAEAGAQEPGNEYEIEEVRARPSSYGNRVIEPRVVGLYKNSAEFRFFVVPDRKSRTLRDLLRRCLAYGNVVQTDEWAGYARLREDGYRHETVNHSGWFIYPNTGVHTQGIERLWVDAKSIMKRHRHTTPLLQSHLDTVAWRRRNESGSLSLISR